MIPNRYPIFRSDAQPDGLRDSRLFSSLPGLGTHEVTIEMSDHHQDLADSSLDQAVRAVETYGARVAELSASPSVRHVSVFRNRGKSAGASLAHSHARVVATAAVPDGVRTRIERERGYQAKVGRCLVIDLLQAAARDRRLIEEHEGDVLWSPYAPVSPTRCAWRPRIIASASMNLLPVEPLHYSFSGR